MRRAPEAIACAWRSMKRLHRICVRSCVQRTFLDPFERRESAVFFFRCAGSQRTARTVVSLVRCDQRPSHAHSLTHALYNGGRTRIGGCPAARGSGWLWRHVKSCCRSALPRMSCCVRRVALAGCPAAARLLVFPCMCALAMNAPLRACRADCSRASAPPRLTHPPCPPCASPRRWRRCRQRGQWVFAAS